ncbi:hypothetical protein MMC09_007079 [Bachmanniomyces sp. S44760]|nr:hypothetical protein [Bachmanniomyces sp. S44760]
MHLHSLTVFSLVTLFSPLSSSTPVFPPSDQSSTETKHHDDPLYRREANNGNTLPPTLVRRSKSSRYSTFERRYALPQDSIESAELAALNLPSPATGVSGGTTPPPGVVGSPSLSFGPGGDAGGEIGPWQPPSVTDSASIVSNSGSSSSATASATPLVSPNPTGNCTGVGAFPDAPPTSPANSGLILSYQNGSIPLIPPYTNPGQWCGILSGGWSSAPFPLLAATSYNITVILYLSPGTANGEFTLLRSIENANTGWLPSSPTAVWDGAPYNISGAGNDTLPTFTTDATVTDIVDYTLHFESDANSTAVWVAVEVPPPCAAVAGQAVC